MKTCFIYVRVSTEEQAREGYSIEAQKKACRECAEKLGLHVVDVFSDEGETATAAKRPQFQEMLDRCDEVEAIIVWHTDRFARNEVDHFAVKALLKKANVRLLSVTQPMLDDSPEGSLLDTVLAGVNAFYSRDLSRKTKKGLMQKWEEGWWPGWAPLGYKNAKENNKGVVIIDPETGPAIKKLFELYSTGNYSILQLQKWLLEEGVKSKTDKRLQHSVVHYILNNPFYYGLMRWNSLEKIGNHRPLVPKNLFDQCQYVLAKHRNFIAYNRKHQFLLNSFIYCENCGQRYTAEWHKIKSQARGNRIAYYHCTRRESCKAPYIELTDLEDQVKNQFGQLKFTEEFIEKVISKARNLITESQQDVTSARKIFLNKRKTLEKKRNMLEDMLLDGTVDRETFKRKHSDIQTQIDEVDKKLIELEGKRDVDLTIIEEVLALARNIPKTYHEAPLELKRQYLRFFFEKIFVKEKKISRIKLTPIFEVLAQEQKLASGYKFDNSAPRPGLEPGTCRLTAYALESQLRR